jgi:hypothetical protein
MISIGGIASNDSRVRDPRVNGLGIFDMTDLTWGFNYDANAAPYVHSNLVSNFYSAVSGGVQYPQTWSDPDLRAIFKDTRGMTTSTPDPQTTGEGSSSSSSVNIGAIVGGVVAGVFVLAAIAAGIFLLLRRRNRKQPKEAEIIAKESHTPPKSELDTFDTQRYQPVAPVEIAEESPKHEALPPVELADHQYVAPKRKKLSST